VFAVSVLETIIVFVGMPAAIYGVVALLTLRDRAKKSPRYRPGQDWEYAPVWWSANPAGVAGGRTVAELTPVQPAGEDASAPAASASGGARGSW
jgi:hypothetical protein